MRLRTVVESILPKPLSRKVVAWGQSYKKLQRQKARLSYGGGRAFVKDITALGVPFKILIDPSENSGVDECIALDGYWETYLGSQFIKTIKKDSVFLDIGANIGYHSLFVAALLAREKGSGTVYAFEPVPRLCDQMRTSITLNGFTNIQVCNFGLSEKEGTETIYVRDENAGGTTLLAPEAHDFAVKSSETVILKKLDLFLGSDARVDVIKIDVEGYEYEALKGGVEILKKQHPIVFIEFSPRFYIQDNVQKPYEVIALFENLGYSFFTLDDAPLDLRAWLKEGDNLHSQIDIMCKPS